MSAAEERQIVADLQSARADGKGGRKSRSLLASPAPEQGSAQVEIAGWLTVALGVGANPIERAERYGRTDDSRLTLIMRSGQRITFERQADAFDARRLVRVVVTATGATVPPYQYADGLQVASAIVRLAETLAEDDERGEAIDWGHTFLEAAAANAVTVTDLSTPAGRWEALSVLMTWKRPAGEAPYTPVGERSPLIVDANATRMLRTSDFAAHVRHLVGRPLSWGQLHSRMVEVGWLHPGRVQQRQPGGQGKRKARVYVVPAAWDAE